MAAKTLALTFAALLAGLAQGQQAGSMCWAPGSNPFRGVPTATRLDRATVRVDWASTFSASGPACSSNVDFLIKSHPRFQPSAYKLSDFAPRGQMSAVLQIDGGTDYVFQAGTLTVTFHDFSDFLRNFFFLFVARD